MIGLNGTFVAASHRIASGSRNAAANNHPESKRVALHIADVGRIKLNGQNESFRLNDYFK